MPTKAWFPRLGLVLAVLLVMSLLFATGVLATSTVQDNPMAAASVGDSIVRASHDLYTIDWVRTASGARGG